MAGRAGAQSNGTEVGSPAYVARTNFGQAISLNGSSQYVTIPDPGPFDFPAGSSYTVEGFCQTTITTGIQVITGVHESGGPGIWVGVNGGKLAASPFADGSMIVGAGVIADGNFHHFALVVSGGTSATLFQDGVSVATGTGTYTPAAVDAAYIGAFGASGGTANDFPGQIDEIRISSTARYTAGFTPPTAPFTLDSSTKSLYHLDGSVADAVVSTQTITADNAAWVISPYNWVRTGSGASSSDVAVCPGAYRRILYSSSTSATLSFNVANIGSPGPVIAVRFDNNGWTRYPEAATVTLSPPASRSQPRLLEIAFASVNNSADRWTSGPPVGSVQFTGLTLDGGATVTAPAARPKNVLVLGDSIKEGFLTLSSTGVNTTDNDATLAYPFLLQSALNAEVGVVAYAGQALLNTNNTASSHVPALPNSYSLYYAGVTRSFLPQPDLLVLDEGQNDPAGTAGIQAAYQSVISGVGAKKTLVMGDLLGANSAAAQAAAVATGAFYSSPAVLVAGDKLDSYHPTAAAHTTKMLPAVAGAAYPVLYGATTILPLVPTRQPSRGR